MATQKRTVKVAGESPIDGHLQRAFTALCSAEAVAKEKLLPRTAKALGKILGRFSTIRDRARKEYKNQVRSVARTAQRKVHVEKHVAALREKIAKSEAALAKLTKT